MSTWSRRKFLSVSAAASAGVVLASKPLSSFAALSNPAESPLKNKKVLFVYGGWEGHEPKESADLFVPWLKSEGAEVVVSDNLDVYTDKTLMDSVDLIVQSITMSKITSEQESGLLNSIQNGCGFAGWHGGIGDSFRDNPEYQFMVGGQWVSHPGGIIDYVVNITDSGDEVMRGITDFEVRSEQYYMHVDPNVKVLATTVFSGEHLAWIDGSVIPVVWKKYYGKGRVFYSSLGHVMQDFEQFEVFEIQKRGIRWAAQSKYQPREKWIHPIYG